MIEKCQDKEAKNTKLNIKIMINKIKSLKDHNHKWMSQLQEYNIKLNLFVKIIINNKKELEPIVILHYFLLIKLCKIYHFDQLVITK